MQLLWNALVLLYSAARQGILFQQVHVQPEAGVPIVSVHVIPLVQKLGYQVQHHLLTCGHAWVVGTNSFKNRLHLVDGVLLSSIHLEAKTVATTSFDATIGLAAQVYFDAKPCTLQQNVLAEYQPTFSKQ